MPAVQPNPIDLSPGTTESWLRLCRLPGVGASGKRALVTRLGGPESLFELNQQSVVELLKLDSVAAQRLRECDPALLEADLDSMARHDIRYVSFLDPAFPPLLNQISEPPLGLFVRGNIALLGAPQLAVVGSRKPTPSGLRTTESFAAKLSRSGLTINSGLAVGIDSAAHRGCLGANGNTLAVVATGLDRVYPKSNQRLSDEIAERGLLVSEFVPGTEPRKASFPQRNRLISGLSLGVLVVEASIRSGSLITARTAGEQGREVFAIPGSIHVPTSHGCHFLIRSGARLVETIDDILEEIRPSFTASRSATAANPAAANPVAAGPVERQAVALFAQIDYTPTPIDCLIQQSGLTADEVSYMLINLEMKGLIASTPSGYQRLPV